MEGDEEDARQTCCRSEEAKNGVGQWRVRQHGAPEHLRRRRRRVAQLPSSLNLTRNARAVQAVSTGLYKMQVQSAKIKKMQALLSGFFGHYRDHGGSEEGDEEARHGCALGERSRGCSRDGSDDAIRRGTYRRRRLDGKVFH